MKKSGNKNQPDAEAGHIAEQDSANRKTPAATIVGLNPSAHFRVRVVIPRATSVSAEIISVLTRRVFPAPLNSKMVPFAHFKSRFCLMRTVSVPPPEQPPCSSSIYLISYSSIYLI